MKEAYRDRRALGSLTTDCVRDARFALRLLIKERWFAATAILVLSLGIAANNTVFVLTNGLLLRDLPFADPDRIVTIGMSVGGSEPSERRHLISRSPGLVRVAAHVRWLPARCLVRRRPARCSRRFRPKPSRAGSASPQIEQYFNSIRITESALRAEQSQRLGGAGHALCAPSRPHALRVRRALAAQDRGRRLCR